jgi:farnesyl-diphosphate farnesyltransferase
VAAPLDELLKSVSRSFYLSLRILPRALRAPVSAAYLVARAADTIADTRLVRAERRLELLGKLRRAIADGDYVREYVGEVQRELLPNGQGNPDERRLLLELGDCLSFARGFESADRERMHRVLDTLITGMERDLARFGDGGTLVALETLADLDEYTYFAAGCVGEYWTVMTAAHLPAAARLGRPDFVARGVRLGKALQMVNVIRDAGADLRQGRCYIPRSLLAANGLVPHDLREPAARRRARPVVDELCRLALAHVDAALPYVLRIPPVEPRLRLAALWPLWIGLATLAEIRRSDDPLDPALPIKVGRQAVYRILAESSLVVGLDRALVAVHDRRRQAAAA